MKRLTVFIFFFFGLTFLSAQEKKKSVFDVSRSGTVVQLTELMKYNPNIINTTDDNGFSPLILACYRGNIDVANFLIDNVKNLNYKSQEGTALAALSVRYNKDLTEHLLKKKADPDIADKNGTTPLIWAVKSQNKDLVELLLEYKADKTIKDFDGFSPFEYALKTDNKEIINILKN